MKILNWINSCRESRQTRKRKFCPGCTTNKPVSEFETSPRGEVRGYSIYCKECIKWYNDHEMTYIKTQTESDEFINQAF